MPEAVEDRQHEGRGLSGAGLGRREDVAAVEHERDRSRLDGSGFLVALLDHGGEEIGRQAERVEGQAFSWRAGASRANESGLTERSGRPAEDNGRSPVATPEPHADRGPAPISPARLVRLGESSGCTPVGYSDQPAPRPRTSEDRRNNRRPPPPTAGSCHHAGFPSLADRTGSPRSTAVWPCARSRAGRRVRPPLLPGRASTTVATAPAAVFRQRGGTTFRR